jgi:isopentenyl diphosphate isomerase/L-lactate dehydrogenase-like FMN-dependent dehydrogenase
MNSRQSNNESASSALPVNIPDFMALAKARMPAAVFDYVECGACDELTKNANRRDLDAIRLVPLCLRDVAHVDLSANLFERSYPFPVGFSPTAFHRLAHPGGEVSSAKAARALGIPMIVSSMSSIPLEEIAQRSGNDDLWFQTYIFKDRGLTRELVQRAEGSGYKSIVITTGCPVPGKRDKNIRNRFALPGEVVAANIGATSRVVHNNPIHSAEGAELDPAVTWKDIDWLRSKTPLPIILKGVINPLDVAPALDLQVAGLILSNHGGRQLDTTESTIRMLPDVAAAVSGRVPLLIDSGFRRGTDVLKALALGADGVLLGRPVLWALAVDGERGVIGAVEILIEELRIAMQLVGCATVRALRSNAPHVIRRGSVR